MKKVVALVPIKLNNERVPGKNLKCFSDGTTLLEHSLTTLASVETIDEIYCFCSSPEVQKFFPKKGNEVKFLQRSASLDTAETKSQDILAAFINQVDADVYALFHVTSPFVSKTSIKTCIDKVVNDQYDSANLVKKVEDFLWMDGKPVNFNPEKIARTQDLPEVVKEITGLYVFEKEVFLKYNRRVGVNPYKCYIDSIEEIDIDYPSDFELAKAVYDYKMAHKDL